MSNIPGTNVPGISFGPLGFQIPTGPAILVGVQADISAAFGSALNFSPTTPQGQLATSLEAVINNANGVLLWLTQQMDPSYAQGRFQDAIGTIYRITRIGAQPTTINVSCTGGLNVVIPIGSTVVDSANNLYVSVATGTIPASGSITLPFAAAVPGPLAVPASVSIYQSISGWDSATVVGGTQGNATESRFAFEARRQQSLLVNALGMLGAIQGNVLSVPGVTDCYVTENPNSTPLSVGGVTLSPNSIYVAVAGTALNSAIATAIWTAKMPGVGYNGSTTATIQDTTQPNPPFPSYAINWTTPSFLPFSFSVSIVASPQVPANATQLIQNAIVAAFTGQAQATFTASITGSIMTVSSVQSGIISAGQPLIGNTIVPGTTISGGVSGSGGAGTYTVSIPQTVGSTILGSGGDGGPRMRIGALVLASRFFSVIASLGSWAQIRSILIGSSNAPAASFTGSIAGTTLTVSGVTGTISVGYLLVDVAGNVAPGTTIVSGSGTSWVVSISQTVASEPMVTFINTLAAVQANINQEPTIATGNIFVAVS